MGFESYRRSAEDLRSEGNAQKKDKDLRTRVHAVFKRNLRPKNCRGEGIGLHLCTRIPCMRTLTQVPKIRSVLATSLLLL
jgi:hypothetical protein